MSEIGIWVVDSDQLHPLPPSSNGRFAPLLDLPTLGASRGVSVIGPTVLDGAAIPNGSIGPAASGPEYALVVVLGLWVTHPRLLAVSLSQTPEWF
jgi:hypothetical protein